MSIAEKLTVVAENQQKVYQAGINEGYGLGKIDGEMEGYQAGYDAGNEEGIAAGAKSEYDRFWDSAQSNGEKTVYTCAFSGYCWNDDTYDPKYPITATINANYMFWNSRITDTKVDITVPNSSVNVSNVFAAASNLVTIRKLTVGEKTVYNNCFTGCTNLEELTMAGTIGAELSLSPCTKLTHDSLMSVIGCLKDFVAEGAGTTKTLTLGTANLAKLTDGEKAIATEKGWTLA